MKTLNVKAQSSNPPQSPFACLWQEKDTKGGGYTSLYQREAGRDLRIVLL
jgi:hypothetical protein